MLFNSFTCLFLFLPAAVAGCVLLRARLGPVWAQGWLIVASLVFYGYAKPAYLPLLLASIFFNWALARWMTRQEDERRRKLLLRVGLIVNIAVLCLFKYSNFFLRAVAGLHGPAWNLPRWEFPVGISFFTLTQVMYLVDTYQGLNQAHSLFDHAAFVALFPYITSGPLVRARAVVPQLRKYTLAEAPLDAVCRGLFLFGLGIAKKVVLADSFAKVADAGFNSIRDFSLLEAWVFAFAFLFQLYFDFSGYSDMAVGCAWMIGIDIPQNFNAPFRAKSISEFWQRWHISLSNFITSYLYTPMLRSMRKPTLRASVVATVLAMTIAGLWHGPAWTFAAYGLSHGVALGANQAWRKRKLRMPDWLGWLMTLLFVCSSLVFFRSPDMLSALHMLSRMLPHSNLLGTAALHGVLPASLAVLARPAVLGVPLALLFKSSLDLSKAFRPSLQTSLITAALFLVALFFMNSAPSKQFVYFAF